MEVSRQRRPHRFLQLPSALPRDGRGQTGAAGAHGPRRRLHADARATLSVQEALCGSVFLMTSRHRDHGLHFGDTRPGLLGLHSAATARGRRARLRRGRVCRRAAARPAWAPATPGLAFRLLLHSGAGNEAFAPERFLFLLYFNYSPEKA